MTKIVESVRAKLAGDWIPVLYLEKVRSQRTRSFHLNVASKETSPEILYTLLGIEIKVGNRRFACPDLPTARYIRVFARIGCSDFAVPYDISKISVIADELKPPGTGRSWSSTENCRNRSSHSRPGKICSHPPDSR